MSAQQRVLGVVLGGQVQDQAESAADGPGGGGGEVEGGAWMGQVQEHRTKLRAQQMELVENEWRGVGIGGRG